MSGLATAATRGSAWLAVVNLVSKGCQAVVTLVLAALFTEAELGVVALVVAVVNVGQVVQAMGVYDVISRTARDPRRMAGTVLVLSVGVGVAMTAVAVAFAPAIAALLGAPSAAPLLRLAALSLPFTAVGGVQMGLMHRDLDFRRRLVPDAGSALFGAAVTIVGAAAGAGPVALVLGLLCTAVAQPLLGVCVGVRVRPCWDRAAAGEATRWIAVVGPAAVIGTLLVVVGYPVIGRVLGPDAAGIYALAYRIAWMPYVMAAVVLGAVAFPVFTRMLRDGQGERLPAAVARFTRVTALVAGGAYVGAAVLADRVVLLGQRWAPAAGALVLLCGYGLALSLNHIWCEAIRATGHTGRFLALQAAHLATLVVALLVLTPHGVTAAAGGHAVVGAVMVVLTWCTLAGLGLAPGARETLGLVAGVGAVLVGSALPVLALDRFGFLGPPRSLWGAGAAAAVFLVCLAAATALTHRPLLNELRRALAGIGAPR